MSDIRLDGSNIIYLEKLYQQYLNNPDSVSPEMKAFFSQYEGNTQGLNKYATNDAIVSRNETLSALDSLWVEVKKPSTSKESTTSQASLSGLNLKAQTYVEAMRNYGHCAAQLDPLGLQPATSHPLVAKALANFTQEEYKQTIQIPSYNHNQPTTVEQLIRHLTTVYSQTTAFEFNYSSQRDWWIEKLENQPQLQDKQKSLKALQNLVKAVGFEEYLHVKFVGVKRFGLDGGESFVSGFEAMLEKFAELSGQNVVIGMAHRGRLNTLCNILQKPFVNLFAEFKGVANLESMYGSGDVKYHMGYSVDRQINNYKVHLTLLPNPSHLETVNPLVIGKAFALQENKNKQSVLPVLIHGDASFAGQGVVYETITMADIPAFSVGGTLHIVINNQVGFTANPTDSRSTRYTTDLAKMLDAPVIHVNADSVEAVVKAFELAIEYRQTFLKEIFIDLVGYRRFGHNEGDEPRFTQPLMYKEMKDLPKVRDIYFESLEKQGLVDKNQLNKWNAEYKLVLDEAFVAANQFKPELKDKDFSDWASFFNEGKANGFNETYVNDFKGKPLTVEQLKQWGELLVKLPDGLNLHPTIQKFITTRSEMLASGSWDWSLGEALAFASLLTEGHSVRLDGQDARRGTFSHRHAALIDQQTGASYYPLNNLDPQQAKLSVADSFLSEYGCLGFAYGYSWHKPNGLTIWEAQYGDFANGAQIIMDQYISGAEQKWLFLSNLVMLLPHGYEGQGPEHSSARLERYLQLCAEDNIQVAICTTPANYFHILRRQIKRKTRKPLIMMSPKSYLRNKLAVSDAKDFTQTFQPVIDDTSALKQVKRVVLCTGKFYYDLVAEREKLDNKSVAIVRIEELYPFPQQTLSTLLSRYRGADIVWAQEEPKNMGAWSFIQPYLVASLQQAQLGSSVTYYGRQANAATATGLSYTHNKEQNAILTAIFNI